MAVEGWLACMSVFEVGNFLRTFHSQSGDTMILMNSVHMFSQFGEILFTVYQFFPDQSHAGKFLTLSSPPSTHRLDVHCKMFTINPKDRSVNELYGYLDRTTREWVDGLLSFLFRTMNQATETPEKRFLVFDGDVDALWIENMNSVMDDNRLLTLVNGERIRLQPYASLLFEVSGLQYASPATVSRCGMVYVDPSGLGYLPYWNSWVGMHAGSDVYSVQFSLVYCKFFSMKYRLKLFHGFTNCQWCSACTTC